MVAKDRLSFGAPVRKEQLRLVKWPGDAVPEGAFTSVENLFGYVEFSESNFDIANFTSFIDYFKDPTKSDHLFGVPMEASRTLMEESLDILHASFLRRPVSFHGHSLSWGYYHMGMLAFEIELGDLFDSAGFTRKEQAARLDEFLRERFSSKT